MSERKHYLDNIRWITVLLVIVYHIFYIFNCSGVISNLNIQGIPQMDTIEIFMYPWFMCLLFVISGIASKYSLAKRTNKEFIKDRFKRILLPSIGGIFVYGWISGFFTNLYTDIFAGNGAMIPGFIKYIIFCLMGMGPLWYCHVIFVASILLVIIRKIDKKDKISELCKKTHPLMLIPMTFLVWGSSMILNMPLITVYRFGIYLFMFFLGYYVFSNEEILEKMEKLSIPMIILTAIVGIIYTAVTYGKNFTSDEVLQGLFTNTYLWLAIISILTFGRKYLNFTNKFSEYMTKNNFGYYVLHYNLLLVIGYLVVTYLHLPFMLNYLLIMILTAIILPVIIEIVKRIPVIRAMVLGIYRKKENKIK